MPDSKPRGVFDGYWLPSALREQVLSGAVWETFWLKGGVLIPESVPGAVAVRWPRLAPLQWSVLLDGLQKARTVKGSEVLARWQAALGAALAQLAEQLPATLPTLSICTGYSPAMLAKALWHGELINPQLLSAALKFQPRCSLATRWEQMPGLPGRVRFFPQHKLQRAFSTLRSQAPLGRPAPPLDLALGYAAGNVPGTALLIALLSSLANYARGDELAAPAVLVRNSRHEPLFAPWVLAVIEAIDPTLVAGLAVLVWDYDDGNESLQRELLRRAGLMVAAAGDETIAALDAARARLAPNVRFHRHGHKVSFAVIQEPKPELALLAALDSAVWDQNGCLSARVHFVQGDAAAYAQTLAEQLRALTEWLPRGATPRRFIHRAIDSYAALSGSGRVQVYSTYDDDFAVILDARPWDGQVLSRVVNACVGRVVMVRPVKSVLEAPATLRWLPPANLQSVSVAMQPALVPQFAQAAGECGVTAIRSLGRAAFPQLAYSWDGLLPVDVGMLRPAGHFTTIEFDDLPLELDATLERWKGAGDS